MRKAKDERVRITAAFFRVSFDEDDEEAKKDKASLTSKESRKLSRTISLPESDSGKVQKKSDNTKAKTLSDSVVPDFELARIFDRSRWSYEEKPPPGPSNDAGEQNKTVDRHRAMEGQSKHGDDASSKIETRRRSTVPMINSDGSVSAFKCDDFVTMERPTRFRSSSSYDHLPRSHTKSISTNKSRQPQLIVNLLEVSSETSEIDEQFRSLKLPKQSTGENKHSPSSVGKVSDTALRSVTTAIQDNLNDEKSDKSGGSGRRSTLPMTNADLNQSGLQENATISQKSPTFEDIVAGTSVNPIRKFSIANAAICSSLAPSLLGAIPGVPNSLLPNGDHNLQRSATLSNLSTSSTVAIDDVSSVGRTRRRLKSFLRLQIPELNSNANWHDAENYHDHLHHQHHDHHHHHHHHMFPHIPVPTITFTAPADGTGRKFNFAIRRYSQAVSV